MSMTSTFGSPLTYRGLDAYVNQSSLTSPLAELAHSPEKSKTGHATLPIELKLKLQATVKQVEARIKQQTEDKKFGTQENIGTLSLTTSPLDELECTPSEITARSSALSQTLQEKIKAKLREIEEKLKKESGSELGFLMKKINDIAKIRFSQITISPYLSSGQSLETLEEDILAGNWQNNNPLTVIRMPDGNLTSLDNRRLYVLKKVEERCPHLNVLIQVINFDEVLSRQDKVRLIVEKRASERTAISRNARNASIDEGTYGFGVIHRMYGRGEEHTALLGRTSQESIYGYNELPIVETTSSKRMTAIYYMQQRYNR